MKEIRVENGIIEVYNDGRIRVLVEDSLVPDDQCWFASIEEAKSFCANEARLAQERAAIRAATPEPIRQSYAQWSFR